MVSRPHLGAFSKRGSSHGNTSILCACCVHPHPNPPLFLMRSKHCATSFQAADTRTCSAVRARTLSFGFRWAWYRSAPKPHECRRRIVVFCPRYLVGCRETTLCCSRLALSNSLESLTEEPFVDVRCVADTASKVERCDTSLVCFVSSAPTTMCRESSSDVRRGPEREPSRGGEERCAGAAAR